MKDRLKTMRDYMLSNEDWYYNDMLHSHLIVDLDDPTFKEYKNSPGINTLGDINTRKSRMINKYCENLYKSLYND